MHLKGWLSAHTDQVTMLSTRNLMSTSSTASIKQIVRSLHT